MLGLRGSVVFGILCAPGVVVFGILGHPGGVVFGMLSPPGVVAFGLLCPPGLVVFVILSSPAVVVFGMLGPPGVVAFGILGPPGVVVFGILSLPDAIVFEMLGLPGVVVLGIPGSPPVVVFGILGRPGVVALRKRRTRPAPVAARGAAVRDGPRGLRVPGVLHAGSDSRSSSESLGGRAPDEQRPILRRRAGGLPTSVALQVATAGSVEGGGDGVAAGDPEGGRRAPAHVGDGAREVAATRARVTNVFYSSNRQV